MVLPAALCSATRSGLSTAERITSTSWTYQSAWSCSSLTLFTLATSNFKIFAAMLSAFYSSKPLCFLLSEMVLEARQRVTLCDHLLERTQVKTTLEI